MRIDIPSQFTLISYTKSSKKSISILHKSEEAEIMDFDLAKILDSNTQLSRRLVGDILSLNEVIGQYALQLSEADAKMIAAVDLDSIRDNDRIQFAKSAVLKIIARFSQSSYISQSDFALTIAELTEIFYQVKEESLDGLTDDEVIDVMFHFFEKKSGGDLELLANRDMEALVRCLRNGETYCEDDF